MSEGFGVTTRRLSALSAPMAIVVAAFVRFGAPFEPAGATMLAITGVCIVLWIGNLVPPSYTGILCLGILGVTFSTELALVGFRSPATWLIAFGLVMGEATRRSGLAEWTSRWIMQQSMPAAPATQPHRTFRRLLMGTSIGSFLLTLLVPVGLVRVLVLAPVLLEVGRQFDSRKARIGLFLGPLFATYHGTTGILTGGSPNIVTVGIFESISGISVTWTEWFVLMFPVMGVGRLLVVLAVSFFLYRPGSDLQMTAAETERRPMTSAERRMFAALLAGVLVWMTDSLHGLHPVYGAMLVVILAFLPSVGAVEFEPTLDDVDFSILFFVAAVLAIGEGLTQTGVADQLAGWLLTVVPTDAQLVVVLGAVFLVTLALKFVMGGLAAASVVTPIVVAFAADAGLPPTPIVLAEASTIGLDFFPYQSAVLVVMLAYDIVEPRDLIRTAAAITLAIIVFLIPIQLLVLAWAF